jgi:DNA-binding response OmpR family regulator
MATLSSPFRLRVLIVDACPNIRASSLLLLALWGHEGRAAPDGVSALATARRFRPEVVLADLSLPGLDGYCLARRLRSVRRLRGALLIAVTARGGAADRRKARDAGFDDYLVKPDGLPEMRALLAACADGC